jgi:hypothetical protein
MMANRINRVGVSSLASRSKIIVEPSKDEPGMWYWALVIDGEIHSDGTASTESVANIRAVDAWDDWLEKQ